MSLNHLPPELILAIADFLPLNADKQSPRITCRGFRPLFPPPTKLRDLYHLKLSKNKLTLRLYDRRDFLNRLLRSGDIFADLPSNITAHTCSTCSRIRPSSRFPLPTLLIGGSQVCDWCIAGLLGKDLTITPEVEYKKRKITCCPRCRNNPVLDTYSLDPITGQRLCPRCDPDGPFR